MLPRRLKIWSPTDVPRRRVRSALQALLLRVDAGGEGEMPLILPQLVDLAVLGEALGQTGEQMKHKIATTATTGRRA